MSPKIWTTILFLSLSMGHLVAQSNSVVGLWTLDINRTVELMGGTQKTNFGNLPTEKKNEIKQNFSQRSFHFQTNGSFEVQWLVRQSPRQASGVWSIDGQRVAITVSGKESFYKVRAVDTSHLVLEKEGGDEGLFNVLAFIRQ